MSGLFEGHSYYFRVRAVNSHGISKASRMSDPIAALDPTEFEKLHSGLDLNIINIILCYNIMQVFIQDQPCTFQYFFCWNLFVIVIFRYYKWLTLQSSITGHKYLLLYCFNFTFSLFLQPKNLEGSWKLCLTMMKWKVRAKLSTFLNWRVKRHGAFITVDSATLQFL